jgi:hypothetical protein
MSTTRRRRNNRANLENVEEHNNNHQEVVLQGNSTPVNYAHLIEVQTMKSRDFKWVTSFSSDKKLLSKQLHLFLVELKREKLDGYVVEVPDQQFEPEVGSDSFDRFLYKFTVFNTNVNDANSIMSRALQENHYVILTQVQRLASHLQAPTAYLKLLKLMGRSGDALSKSKLSTEWENIKMKVGAPVRLNFDNVVKEITTVSNSFGGIQAANPDSYCLKSDEDCMIKLSSAVTADLKVRATNYLISNVDKSFGGLQEGLQVHIESVEDTPEVDINSTN